MAKEYEDCVVLAVSVAEGMLRSGGETYRAQECCENILKSCGAENINVVGLTTAILVSADVGGEHRTEVISVKTRDTDLWGIERYNDISRRISTGALGMDEAFEELKATRKKRFWIVLLYGALSSTFFSVVFGGSFRELLPALAAAAFAQLFKITAEKISGNAALSTMGACMITAALTRLFVWLCPSLNQEAVIVGGIVAMVPGLAITNALRDTLHGDIISGLARGADALITAVLIAAGVAIVLAI